MLEDTNMRNDIKIGEAAAQIAAESFGRDGTASDEALLRRTKMLYRWLKTERKD